MVLTTAVFAGAQTDQIQVILDGEVLVFDQPPIIENSRTLVPLRVIFEALGADVEWTQSTRTATATKDDTLITVRIDNPVMTKDGENITLEAPPRLVNSHTLVPVRAIAEAFGVYVDWDNINKNVIISASPFLTREISRDGGYKTMGMYVYDNDGTANEWITFELPAIWDGTHSVFGIESMRVNMWSVQTATRESVLKEINDAKAQEDEVFYKKIIDEKIYQTSNFEVFHLKLEGLDDVDEGMTNIIHIFKMYANGERFDMSSYVFAEDTPENDAIIKRIAESVRFQHDIETASLLFPLNAVTKPANDMSDAELVTLLEKLVKNADDLVGGWILSGIGLALDEQSVFDGGNPNARYVEVKNIKDMASLKANLEIVFSNRFLEDLVFPFIFDKELPLFIEQGGKLYFDNGRGGGGGPPSDFTRAKIINKGASTFEIEVPLAAITDEEKLFIYKAVQQNGNWVLDSYWWIIG